MIKFWWPLFFLCGALYAQVSLQVDQNSVSLDDSITLEVRLAGLSNPSDPKIEGLQNFEVQDSGVSSQISIINGRTSMSKVLTYTLYPKRIGNITLGPATVEAGGKTYQSSAFVITVSNNSQPAPRAQPQQKQAPDDEENERLDDNRKSANTNQYFYITGEVINKEPYKGEQFIYTFKLMQRLSLNAPQLDLPTFQGFWKEQLGKEKQYNQVINGIEWHIYELNFLLSATQSGKLTIDSAKLTGQAALGGQSRRSIFDSFFDGQFAPMKRISLRSQPVEVHVREVPTENKPQNFSGLVGNFQLLAQASANQVKRGESITLTLVLTGEGNANDAQAPEIPSGDFKTYDDKPTFEIKPDGNRILSRKTWKKALVPQKEGELSIPSLRISYFNTKTGNYEWAQSNAITLKVLPGDSNEDNLLLTRGTEPSQKKSVEILGLDLMPIVYSSSSLKPGVLTRLPVIFLWAINLLFPFIFLLLYLYKRRQEIFKNDTTLEKRSKAYKTFQNNIRQVEIKGKFYEITQSALKNYIGDKLGIDGMALTAIDLERLLTPKKVTAKTLSTIGKMMNNLDSGIYGGANHEPEKKKMMLSEIKELVVALEKEIR